MLNYINNIKSQFSFNILNFIAIIILSIYPITFFIGTTFVNLFVVALDLILIIELIKEKKIFFLKNYVFYYLISLWLILLINLFFSIDPQNSMSRSFGFVRYIFFVMAIIYYLNIYDRKYQKIILFTWSIIFIIVSLDLVYEIYFGHNILGFTSYIPGRLSGFFNDELIIGHFYYAFCLIIISFFLTLNVSKKYKLFKFYFNIKDIVLILSFVIIIISFFIGERSNFFKLIFILFSFILLIKIKFDFKKLTIIFILLAILITTINFNQGYKKRFLNQLFLPLIKNPISYISSTNYGDHYKFGLQIFLDNKFFGVGLKNYRIEVGNRNYVNSSIHPHQTHIEILSELGIVGYISFFIFFIASYLNYKKRINETNKYLKLAGLLFVLSTFIPLLPSGSFFTSNTATLFWMNFAFMNLSQKLKL